MISSERPGASRLGVRLVVADAESVERVRQLVEEEADEEEEDRPNSPDEEEEGPGDLRSLLPSGLHRLDLHVVGPDGGEELHRIHPESPWSLPDPVPWSGSAPGDFTLSAFYTLDGIYRDTRDDLVPDRTDAYLSISGAEGAAGVVNLAQRIGLETAGIRLPMARPAGEDDRPGELGFPILYGVDHYGIRRLREAGRLGSIDVPAGPGQGFVEFVPEAFDDAHVLVVGGGDAAGLEAAADLLARRIPYLHLPDPARRKGSYRLQEVETEVRRFFQARSGAGRTALALHKLEGWLDRLEAGERPAIPASDEPWPPAPAGEEAPSVESLHLELAVDSVPAGLDALLLERLSDRFPGVPAEVELHPVAFGSGESVLDRELAFEWEVEEARRRLEAEVYPALEARLDESAAGSSEGPDAVPPAPGARIELRVSEPPEIRTALAGEIEDELRTRGVPDGTVEVSVLSAYKQGFSWIEDCVLPRLREVAAAGWDPTAPNPGRIEIQYRHLQESDEVPWQVMGSDTRWLQELFPIDAVLERELGIPDSLVVFRATRDPDGPIYRLTLTDGDGTLLLEESFSPAYVVEPYFHLYPDYERIRITTGWLRAEVEGEALVDRRIRTDMERFWDEWQAEVLPALRDYVMELHEGRVTPGTAPFFDELHIQVRLSEPNHRIGIDEEVISSLESLNNDLYFHTLAFFAHLGQHYGVGSLDFPGRILPDIDPDGEGRAGEARITLTGRERARPELTLRVGAQGEEGGRWRYPLSTLPTEAPKLRGIGLRAGGDELSRLLFDVMARDSLDRFDEERGRASEGAIDRASLPVPLLTGMVEALRGLHDAGLFEDALSFAGVEELAFRMEVEHEEGVHTTVSIPRSAAPLPARNPVLAAQGWEHDGGQIVQWDTPIPPPESDTLLARIATFPEATAYWVGRSFLGREIFAADFHPPVEAELTSQAKLNALRPTLFLSGRQHANEVSSTSHILRLGELLVTDPEYRELLQRVNVVLHPVTNPDGAQLAYDMQLENPDFTHHPGYLGALGVDMAQGAGSDDPIYPESAVRPHLMATWLPDIYLNLHGYPSHEWVQHFSGYAAWVRGRTVTARTWWAPRGWFIPGFTWVDDPDHPEIRTAQFAILDTIAAAITGVPEVREMSQRQYARYAKYGRQEVDGFQEHFHEGVLMYLSLRGQTVSGSGPGNPRINTFSAVTEAPDETARGDWLQLVAEGGLAHTSALARYLAGGVNRVEREVSEEDGRITRQVYRVRPVLPAGEELPESPEPSR